LEQLPERAAIPRAVAEEIFAGPEHDPAISFLSQTPFEIVDVPPAPSDILAWDLGAGESAARHFTPFAPAQIPYIALISGTPVRSFRH